MRRAFLLIIFTLSIALTTAKAQPVSHVRTFNVLDGLPTNSITSIKQAANGLIWIATWNGLCCYDGYRFTTFRGDPWGSDNALSSYRISAIEPDSRDNVWVRTYDGGLYLSTRANADTTMLDWQYRRNTAPPPNHAISTVCRTGTLGLQMRTIS